LDILIKNGLVVDGTGRPGRTADLAVVGDRITAIAALPHGAGRRVIDAAGCVVAPGFIDIHSHSDFLWLLRPRSESKVMDGVTTEVCGNCGSSPFPLRGQLLSHRREGFRKYGLDVDWSDAQGFFRRAERTPASINRAFLVGHGALRACVAGFSSRKPSDAELREMSRELAAAIEAGAFGLSSGLEYPPGCYADADELASLCATARAAGGLYTTHMRNEGDSLEASVNETLSVARRSGVRVQISHLKTAGQDNWSKVEKLKALLEQAIADGVDLGCDRYPYVACSTDLDFLLPQWVYDGGIDAEIARLKDEKVRRDVAQQVVARFHAPDFWDTVLISSVYGLAHKDFEGKTVAQIAQQSGRSPIEVVFDLVIDERGRVGIVMFNMSEDNLCQILSWPFVMVGSDSSVRAVEGPLSDGKPHPRSYGTFSRVLARYWREKRVLGLEQAVWKMTGLPAQRLGLKDRGTLAVGRFADITIFDPSHVTDNATFENPHRYSSGIRHVLVNGQLTVEDGRHTGALNGRILRR